MTVRSSPGTKVFSRDKKTVDTVLEEPRAPGGAPVCSRTALFQLSGQTPPNQGRTETRDLAPLQTHLALSARLFWGTQDATPCKGVVSLPNVSYVLVVPHQTSLLLANERTHFATTSVQTAETVLAP